MDINEVKNLSTNAGMKEGAIILNGVQLVKTVKNKKFNKLVNNPNIKILEECNLDELDSKYDYWERTLNYKKERLEEQERESKLYHFRNPKTGCSITSIYPTLDNIKSYCKDWMDYERDDVEDSE